jgi:SecY interacting protein Syd
MHTLTDLICKTLALTESGTLTSPYDAEWRSPSEQFQSGLVTHWHPVPQETPVNFDGLANAVEAPIHPDIQAYYGSYWSGTLEANSDEGQVSLIQLWNTEDFDRLIANLIGHALMKMKAGLPFTVFFANTDPDTEYFLSIENESGQILLEEPGKPPLRVVDEDIHTFLGRLTPELREPDIY